MQKKQVKIYGFQTNSDKIRLYYERKMDDYYYVIELNRKRILVTKNLNKAIIKYGHTINDKLYQLNLNI